MKQLNTYISEKLKINKEICKEDPSVKLIKDFMQGFFDKYNNILYTIDSYQPKVNKKTVKLKIKDKNISGGLGERWTDIKYMLDRYIRDNLSKMESSIYNYYFPPKQRTYGVLVFLMK